MAAKHAKCCCGEDCLIGSDDFTRADENPVTGDWELRSGEWEILDEVLRNVSEGNLITSLQQSIGPDSSNYAIRMVFDLIGEGPWKVVCRYVDESDYDHIEYTKSGGVVLPAFYKNGSLVMDISTHPGGVGFTWDDTFTEEGGVPQVSICYSTVEWTTQPSVGSGADWTYCAGDPETSMPVGWGLVGFRLGDFDRFSYYRHWESLRSCPYCSCFCDDGVNVNCLPEELTITLTPTVIHEDCTDSPTSLTFTLYQAQPDGSGTYPFDLSPRKYEWFSEPFDSGEAGGPDFWWRLACSGGPNEMELILLEHPSQVDTVASGFFQFKTQDGPNGGSINTTVDCEHICWDFGDMEKIQLQIGSGGPFWCTPFAAKEYSVRVCGPGGIGSMSIGSSFTVT